MTGAAALCKDNHYLDSEGGCTNCELTIDGCEDCRQEKRCDVCKEDHVLNHSTGECELCVATNCD